MAHFIDDRRKTSKTHGKHVPLLTIKTTDLNIIYTYMEYFQKTITSHAYE